MIDNFLTFIIEENEITAGKMSTVYKNNCDEGTVLQLKSIYTLVNLEEKNITIEVNIGRYIDEGKINWVKKYVGNTKIEGYKGVVISNKRYETITSRFPPLVLIGDQDEGIYVIYSKITIGDLKRTSIDYFEIKSKD